MVQTKRQPREAVEAAVAFFKGNATALANAIDVSPQMVSFMRKGERRVPADKCPLIERVTDGSVRCEELRPDVAWDVLRLQAHDDKWDGIERRASKAKKARD